MFNEENTVEQLILDTLRGGASFSSRVAGRSGDSGEWRFIS